jgi:hypothetical protein
MKMKKKGYAMGGMKKKMKAGGGVKKFQAGGRPTGMMTQGQMDDPARAVAAGNRMSEMREKEAAMGKKKPMRPKKRPTAAPMTSMRPKKRPMGMKAGGPTSEGTYMRRLDQANDDTAAVTKKFAERGTSGAAEAKKQKKAIEKKAFADLDNVERYGKDAPKGRSFGQKTQPKQGEMKGKVPLLRKTGPDSDTLTTKAMKKGGGVKKMMGGGMAKKGYKKGGKVRGAGIAQRGVRKAKMR